MKKILLILAFFLLPLGVFAEVKEYNVMELIPIEDIATVDDIGYHYQNFNYVNEVSHQTYGVINFEFVRNKSREKKPLAIDFLLFDENKENIGFVAYCTTKDLTGDYAQLTVNSNGGSPLTVFVDSSYLVKGHTKEEIAYIAVLDSNLKCYVGNHDKYAGLTIEEIAMGKTSPDWNENDIINIFSFILNVGIYSFLGILLLIVTLYVMFVALLNHLNKKMFNKKTKLTWIPGINLIISLNISFGRIVAFIGLLLLAGSIYLGITQGNTILLYLFLGLLFISIFVNIIKLFKKNYNLLFFDPFIKNDGTNPVYYWKTIKVTGQKKAEQILDLNYSDQDLKKGVGVAQFTNPVDAQPVPTPEVKVDSKEDIINKIDDVSKGEDEGFNADVLNSVPQVTNPIPTTPIVDTQQAPAAPTVNAQQAPAASHVVESTTTSDDTPLPSDILALTENNNQTDVVSTNDTLNKLPEDSQSDFMDMFR